MNSDDRYESYYGDRAVRRAQKIVLRVIDTAKGEYFRDALHNVKKIRIDIDEWHGDAYVVEIKESSQYFERSWEITLQPTGAPDDVYDKHHAALERIRLALRSVLTGPRANVIAKTEATRAFNAAKCAELHGRDPDIDFTKAPSKYVLGVKRTEDVSFPINFSFDGTKNFSPASSGFLRDALKASQQSFVRQLDTVIKKELTMKSDKKSRVKFYIGHPRVASGSDGWGKETLAEVIAQATKRCEETGEDQTIVKVIKVVRRKVQPIVVEDVK